MFGNLGMGELAMMLVICLVLFGAKRLPEIGSSIGKGIREFKRGVSHLDDAPEEPAPRPVLAPRLASSGDDDSLPSPKRLMD